MLLAAVLAIIGDLTFWVADHRNVCHNEDAHSLVPHHGGEARKPLTCIIEHRTVETTDPEAVQNPYVAVVLFCGCARRGVCTSPVEILLQR
jgi:hypothetical protein